MNQERKFFICKHCGNIVGMIFSSGVPVVCCGENMHELVPNTSDGAVEKHVPVVKVDGNLVSVTIGSVNHPMIPEHYIQWIYVQTKKGGQRKALQPEDAPTAVFALTEDDKAVTVFAFCNLHGLWKTDL